MTTLLNTITSQVQIQGNHATIHYADHNPETNKVTIQEDIAIAKTKTIQTLLPNTTIEELNRFGINPLDQTKQALLNQLHLELDKELLKLVESLNTQKPLSRFKKFMYWLTQSKPLFYIKSPQDLYSHILHNCYYQRLFVISTPKLIHIFKNHPHFQSVNQTAFEHIQLIGHINGNPIFVNNMINTNGIVSGALPNNIYSNQTNPEFTIEELHHNNQTEIKLETKTILRHIPQHTNRFYHFNATTKPQPLYKKLLKL